METLKLILTDGLVKNAYYSNQTTANLVWLIISTVAIIVCAYLLGSINFAIIISGRQYKQDIRNFGSKNAGMTNMMRTYGKKAAALTLLGDALKAVLSCIIGYVLMGELGAYIAGLFCILGHVFPVFYKFKGGKGVVTAAASVLMCNPFVFLILFTLFVVIVFAFRYISLGSVVCMLLYPIILDRVTVFMTGLEGEPVTSPYIAFTILMAAVIVIKHRANIKRLISGTESKFSFKKSVDAKKKDTQSDSTSL